jgi:hypothetical protein
MKRLCTTEPKTDSNTYWGWVMRGVGIDLVEMNRVKNVNNHFLRKVLTEDELNKYLSLPADVAHFPGWENSS